MQRPMELVRPPCINNFKHFLILLLNSTKIMCNNLFGSIHCFKNITYWWFFFPIHQTKHFCQRATIVSARTTSFQKWTEITRLTTSFPEVSFANLLEFHSVERTKVLKFFLCMYIALKIKKVVADLVLAGFTKFLSLVNFLIKCNNSGL